MTIKPQLHLTRRRLLLGSLGGATLSVALPRFSPLFNIHGEALAAGETPARYLTWGFGCGVVTDRWNPKSTGTGNDWSLSPALEGLQKWKSHLSVVTGVEVSGAGAHGTGNIVYLSGTPCSRKSGPNVPTLDQQIANLRKNPIKSLEVGLTDEQDDRTLGHLYWSHNGSNSPNPPKFNPQEIFDRLFGPAAETVNPDPDALLRAEHLRQLNKSVLDFVRDDAARLATALPSADKPRLEQHMEALRQLESQVAGMDAAKACDPPSDIASAKTPRSFPEADKTNGPLSQLIAMAFACDLTGVATLQTTQAASRANWSDLGISNWHGTSHDDSPGGRDKIQKVVVKHIEWLRQTIEIFENTPDGNGTLLDNSAILTVNEVGQGFTHQGTEMPSLIVGKAGGRLKGDVSYDLGGWAGKVCLTVAHAVGHEMDVFGEGERASREPISELLS